MNKGFKMFLGFVALSLVVGMSANAHRTPIVNEGGDSTKVEEKAPVIPETSVIDEVIWVVGDEPILKSDVEAMRLQSEAEGVRWQGDPDCSIPEQMAVQKLFLHQAAIDSIEVTESEITQGIDDQINHWVQLIGSQEKLEEYRKQTIQQMREEMHDEFKNSKLVQKMREKLVEDISVTPAEVRNYFKNLSEDSIPFVPTEVEVEILTQQPRIPIDEINRVKDELREFTERVNKGETTFATLARMYSEDPVSARQGGELGYTGRGILDPAFASVAFNLTDPKKISKIVETEYGFHIIQLIDKRGDKVNVRHILLKPKASYEVIDQTLARLDSIASDIREGKFTFEDGATMISDDKDTRNNKGLMSNMIESATSRTRTSKFEMKDLPTEIARVVDTLKVNQISQPFKMIDSRGKTTCAIVKLKSRIEGHKATITEDFQVMREVVLNKRRQEALHDWVVDKIKHTYVRMNDRYKDCKFEYQGWVK
ncbi:MAG: peptidylprolyl isomerase [Prevotella sp.]|nr:peptidylprolyl isomerase [Prevotella sp.]MBQ1759283.1 peptidylprolyl isomerase [Prevotella sp.]MBQ2169286.1 peptidylprolyl isomerase [Prevotella sp.]MBQ4028841.1 peptidylprolyl isomerase [Prevotella sp.]MBQ5454884.1 peptidylprolyl isomerase [Prevotella sp.]